MVQRTLQVSVESAKELNKVNLITKMDVYAEVSIYGDDSKQKYKTPVDEYGGNNPSWNFTVKFTINEAAAQQNRLFLVLKLKSKRVLGDKEIGEVRVPIKELLDSHGTSNRKEFVSYQVRKPDGKLKGFINFSYQFVDDGGVKVVEPVTAYPPPNTVGTGSYPPPPRKEEPYPPQPVHGAPVGEYGYPPQHAGHAYPAQQGVYPPQHAGYGGYPPHGYPPQQQGYGYPPQVVMPPKKNNNLGMGLGAGLLGGALGGMLLGEMISDATSYDAYDAGYDAGASSYDPYDGGYDAGSGDGGFDF